jgi:hypothetical protein
MLLFSDGGKELAIGSFHFTKVSVSVCVCVCLCKTYEFANGLIKLVTNIMIPKDDNVRWTTFSLL